MAGEKRSLFPEGTPESELDLYDQAVLAAEAILVFDKIIDLPSPNFQTRQEAFDTIERACGVL